MPENSTEKRFWQMFMTVYSDSTFVRLEPVFGTAHTRKHPTAPEDMTLTRSLKLNFRCYGKIDSRYVGIRGQANGLEPAADDTVRQWEFDSYEHKGTNFSGQLDGVFGIGTAAGGLLVSIPNLPESFPGGVTFSQNTMSVELMPEILPAARYRQRDKEYIQYFYLRHGAYELRGGLEKSFPLYAGFAENRNGYAAALAMQTENIGMVEIPYLNSTGAWYHKIIPPGPLSAPYDSEVRTGLETWFKRRATEKWYGLINYGDWHGERIYNWGNHEYDSATVFFEQALRFREPKYFREALLNARHQIDIDTVHAHPDATLKGAVYAHSIGHTGGYYRHGDFTLANYGSGSNLFIDGRFSMGHTRIGGVAAAYVLDGSPRYRETALATGNFIRRDKMFRRRNWTGTHREPGWALVNLSRLYWFSGDPRFLKSAEILAGIVIEQADGHGVRFDRLAKHNAPDTPHDTTEQDKQYLTGALSFPTGYQTMGMMAIHKITADPELKTQIRENILQCAAYVKQRLYFPERRGFVHSPVPWRPQSTRNGGNSGSALRNVLWMDALLTGNAESRSIAEDTNRQMLVRREIFASPLKDTNPDYPAAKDICSAIYFLPETLEMMDTLQVVIPPFQTDTGNRYIGLDKN